MKLDSKTKKAVELLAKKGFLTSMESHNDCAICHDCSGSGPGVKKGK